MHYSPLTNSLWGHKILTFKPISPFVSLWKYRLYRWWLFQERWAISKINHYSSVWAVTERGTGIAVFTHNVNCGSSSLLCIYSAFTWMYWDLLDDSIQVLFICCSATLAYCIYSSDYCNNVQCKVNFGSGVIVYEVNGRIQVWTPKKIAWVQANTHFGKLKTF